MNGPEKKRFKTLITDTISLLCKNVLAAKSGFSIEGTIGVTCLDDEDDVLLISIKEIIQHIPKKDTSECETQKDQFSSQKPKCKKRRKSKCLDSDTVVRPKSADLFSSVSSKKQEQNLGSDSGDGVMEIKEPARQLHAQIQVPHSGQSVIYEAVCDVASQSHNASFHIPPSTSTMQSMRSMPLLHSSLRLPHSGPSVIDEAVCDVASQPQNVSFHLPPSTSTMQSMRSMPLLRSSPRGGLRHSMGGMASDQYQAQIAQQQQPAMQVRHQYLATNTVEVEIFTGNLI